MTKRPVFPLLFALLLAACGDGLVLNSPDAPAPVLYPPSGISVQALSPSRVKIAWSPVPAAARYNIYQRTANPSGPFTGIASVGPSVYSYENTGLVSTNTYYYQVSAEGAGGEEQISNYSPVVPLTALQTPAPRGSVQSPVSIRLDWDAVPDATGGYNIYRNINSTALGGLLTTVPYNSLFTKYTYYDVAPAGYNTTDSYYYWVKAIGPPAPDSIEGSLPKVNSVIQGIRNTQSAIDLGTVTTPVFGILPQTQLPLEEAIAYYFFSPVSGGTYRIEFSDLVNADGARFSVFLETSGGQQQLLNIIEVGGPGLGKSYTFTPPVAGTGEVVVISSDGRSNKGKFSIQKL